MGKAQTYRQVDATLVRMAYQRHPPSKPTGSLLILVHHLSMLLPMRLSGVEVGVIVEKAGCPGRVSPAGV